MFSMKLDIIDFEEEVTSFKDIKEYLMRCLATICTYPEILLVVVRYYFCECLMLVGER